MKQALLAVLVLILTLPFNAKAQEDLSETFDGEKIFFQYPEGWFAKPDEYGNVALSNKPFPAEERQIFDVESGVLVVNMGNWSRLESEPITVRENDPKFLLGFASGFKWLESILSTLFQSQPSTVIGEIEEIDLEGRAAYLISMEISGPSDIDILLLSAEGGLVVNATCPAGEMDAWRSLILDIAATVQLTENE